MLEMKPSAGSIALATAGAASGVADQPGDGDARGPRTPPRRRRTSRSAPPAAWPRRPRCRRTTTPTPSIRTRPPNGDHDAGPDEPAEVGPARQRRAPPPLHDPVLAAVGDHVGEVRERARHDGEGGERRDVELAERPRPGRGRRSSVAAERRALNISSIPSGSTTVKNIADRDAQELDELEPDLTGEQAERRRPRGCRRPTRQDAGHVSASASRELQEHVLERRPGHA